MQKNRKNRAVKVITSAAMLTALATILGLICKELFTFNWYYRFTVENTPIILAGILYGPLVGGVVGVFSDIISCLVTTGDLNIIITLGAFSVGAVAGTVPCLIRRNVKIQTALSVLFAHLVGQVGIKSIGKMVYWSMPWQGIFIGLGVSLVVGVLETLLIIKLRSIKGMNEIMGG